ncbi:MAG: AbrB/MazE/SpoVT family DNA-binding domain-containing protein [Actinomycetia bacterium]|nr:AbrB/MazE/SpoVT family DNA-binding domain-containing protein [Actinomycetes bacterium]
MKVTEKGQITIPKDIRDALGIGAGTEVEFERDNETIVVRKATGPTTRGRQLAERLRGRGDVAMTTSEIMALTRES